MDCLLYARATLYTRLLCVLALTEQLEPYFYIMNIGVKLDFQHVNIRKGGIENRGRMTKSRFIAIIAQIQRKNGEN